jgi:hypothetical protein
MGLASRPTFWIAPQTSAQGSLLARQARCHVQLNAGLVKKRHTDRPVVSAVVLHELAHVRNRTSGILIVPSPRGGRSFSSGCFPYVLTSVLPLVLGGDTRIVDQWPRCHFGCWR